MDASFSVVIIAKSAFGALPARYIWTRFCKRSINDQANLVRLSVTFHVPLHTQAYYTAVNNMIGKDYSTNQIKGVLSELSLIKTLLLEADGFFR